MLKIDENRNKLHFGQTDDKPYGLMAFLTKPRMWKRVWVRLGCFRTRNHIDCFAHPSKIDPAYPTVPQKAFKSAENLQIYQKSAYIGFLVKPRWFIRFAHITTHFKVLFNAFEKIFKTFFSIIWWRTPPKSTQHTQQYPKKPSKVLKTYRFTKNMHTMGFGSNQGGLYDSMV